jgi:hypothetical protein
MLYLSVQVPVQRPLEAGYDVSGLVILRFELELRLTVDVNVGFTLVGVLATNERRGRGFLVEDSRCSHRSNSKDARDNDVFETNHRKSRCYW